MVDKKEMESERRKRDWERKWNHAKENKIERERERERRMRSVCGRMRECTGKTRKFRERDGD